MGFAIELQIAGGMDDEQKKVFDMAAKRWMEVIQGSNLAPSSSLVLKIRAEGKAIDGPGSTLGQAGPTRVREEDGLPVKGVMIFDSADLDEMEKQETLKSVILHEMGHVLGIGTLWTSKNLLQGMGTNNPEYIGAKAMTEYATLTGESALLPIPVANTGGAGTAEGHWRETTFDYELMTGFVEKDRDMPLSRMTIAALCDLGYKVNFEAADLYEIPKLTQAAVGNEEQNTRHYCTAKFPEVKTERSNGGGWCCC